MGIKGSCKYEQVKSDLKQEKLVHKCGVPQESVKISVRKTVNKTPGQHSSRTDMVHKFPACSYSAVSAAGGLVKHVKCLVLPSLQPNVCPLWVSLLCQGPWNLQMSQVSGWLLDSFRRYLLGLCCFRIQIEFFLFFLSSFSTLLLYF